MTEPPVKSLAPEQPSGVASRIFLLVWLVILSALLLLPLRILSHGFVPAGDARRHVAKAFTDKTYTEIVKFCPDYTIDHSPGWEWLLKQIHLRAGVGQDGLMTFSVCFLMWCVILAPLGWMRKRPEAWVAAMLALLVAIPEWMTRVTQARPYLLTEAVLIGILFSWGEERKPSRTKLTLTTVGICLSIWMHGAWYLWALPLMAFALAQAWTRLLWLSGCVGVGIVAGGLLTGRPYEFLRQALLIVERVQHEHLPQWMMVGEFMPSYGEFATVILIGGLMVARRVFTGERQDWLKDPVFCLIVLGWILGFKADRFWADWGTAAVLVWMAGQFSALLDVAVPRFTPRSLVVACLIAVPFLLDASNDLDRRYSMNLTEPLVDTKDPELKPWLPGEGGIFYTAHMRFFYNTFYLNPNAPWRYILGMEPALMPDDDLKILRQIQLHNYDPRAYQPWVDKMTKVDSIEVESYGKPPLEDVEWHQVAANIWIGRKIFR